MLLIILSSFQRALSVSCIFHFIALPFHQSFFGLLNIMEDMDLFNLYASLRALVSGI